MQFFILLKFKIFILLKKVPIGAKGANTKKAFYCTKAQDRTLTIKILQLIQLSNSCRT